VLILDEPTNDLDVQTLGVLEEYLEEFNGCVIVVSHDRYFLDRTVDTIFSFESEGNLRQYPGNYSVYLDYKKSEEQPQEIKVKKSETPGKENVSSKTNKVSFKEKKEYELLEAKIPKMEMEKEEVETILANSPPQDFREVSKLSERLAQLNQEIDKSTERWLELAERL
jgi:ATP-binding cassette subfamily F protein uup